MTTSTIICHDDQRRQEVRAKSKNGLDYLEVSADQLTLTVYFLGQAPENISTANVRIDGGVRVRDLNVIEVLAVLQEDPELDDYLRVRVDRRGDFSTYTLRLVKTDEFGRPGLEPLDDFDPHYAQLDFSFKVDCPNDLDCKPQAACPPVQRAEPEINYLAKDYASFRQLILDRLALVMPDWTERHVPDLGVTLVELLAYVGDYLSYYQDAVATEAYLDTARQRLSVRRHARLVDYRMHEGCNARTWVCVEIDGGHLALDSRDIFFITGDNDTLLVSGSVLSADELRRVSASLYEVFEPMTEGTIHLYAAHNAIHFYTWGKRECCLPRGAVTATLQDAYVEAPAPTSTTQNIKKRQLQSSTPAQEPERQLHLQVGDVLIFEEVIGPKTGHDADADPTHRHAVRLTGVWPSVDALYNQPIVEIEWAAEEALPFALCISALGPAPVCEYLENLSVARGNVILVDHGRTIDTPEELGQTPVDKTLAVCECEHSPSDIRLVPGRFRPHLQKTPLTFRQALPGPDAPASRLLVQDAREALPQIYLTGIRATSDDANESPNWVARYDLLSSAENDWHFVVEMDNDRRAQLRFGDGELGRAPAAGTTFFATYRIGNGLAGNVGAAAISHLVFRQGSLSGVNLRVRNPLPARGGIDPEPITEVKLLAPFVFRRELQRAITADDYAQIVQRDFKTKVQRAAAALNWTGSWYEASVAVDSFGSEASNPALLEAIYRHLHRYRRIGHDLAVTPAKYVALDIAMTVCVSPHHLRGHVKAALLALFGNRMLANDPAQRGFFHPDNLTFGEGIYVSKLVAAAQAVDGVENVTITKLQRLYENDNHELEDGVLPLSALEVARLDNDPNFPEHGRLVIEVRGGR